MNLDHLKRKPFCLKDEDIRWVEETLSGMTVEEKIGQMFCLIGYTSEEAYLRNLAANVRIGGLMCRPMPAAEAVETVRILQENARIPLLIAANLENGGAGIVQEGTKMGTQMQVAATDDEEMAYKLGLVCGREGAAVGANWGFSPVIDIDYNFRNPITNTRTFGSDPERVRRMGLQYLKGLQENGVAAAIKHFPGDGLDERDQHLATTVNDMSCEEWDATYGEVFKAHIEAGALSVMIGHIMQPAYTRRLNPGITDRDMLPASLSYELTTALLKEQLGFNGLVITDSTTMAGMVIPLPRELAVPQTIAAGCDMFLFTRNFDEDFGYMKKGVETGIIRPERLNDAVSKILAMKAALGLHRKKADGSIVPRLEEARQVVGCEEHQAWARECSDRSITLVKEEPGVLPISAERFRKVLLYGIETAGGGFFDKEKVSAVELFKLRLEQEGFEVDVFNPDKAMEGRMLPYTAVTGKYDLILYIVNLATKSNQTVVRIEWTFPMGANIPFYAASVPTVFISVENPYHLLDVPRVRTYINTYGFSGTVLDALMDKLTGRSAFNGVSPVDPFCGKWDARL